MHILLQDQMTQINFCVVDVESPYNALIGRPWLHSILAVASTFHQCIKFPLPNGIGVIRGDMMESKSCQSIDVQEGEERDSRRRNWRKNVKDQQRAERLNVLAIHREEKQHELEAKEESNGSLKREESYDSLEKEEQYELHANEEIDSMINQVTDQIAMWCIQDAHKGYNRIKIKEGNW